MINETSTIKGSRYLGNPAGKKPKRNPLPRVCHCGARLSAYNSNPTCWLHTNPRYDRRVRGHKTG